MMSRISVIAVVVIVSITALAFHSRKTSKPQWTQADNRAHPAQALALEKLGALLAHHGVRVTKEVRALESNRYRQMEVHWQAKTTSPEASSAEPAQAASGNVTGKALNAAEGQLSHRRALELAATQLLVVAVDDSAILRWWDVITDPRLLRAETVDANGHLITRASYASRSDFIVAYPDDPAITKLLFYQPEWNGESFTLKSVGTLPLR